MIEDVPFWCTVSACAFVVVAMWPWRYPGEPLREEPAVHAPETRHDESEVTHVQ